MGPLKGVRILDLSRVLAGPWATQLLGDLGADVVKVERPGSGDDTRHWGPPYLKDREGKDTAESAYYLAANRAKRSIAIDLADPRGQQLARDLAGRADVLVENFRAGGAKKLGLGFEALQAVNPRLVYCSISAFGQDGPLAAEPGYDAMIQARGGLMSVTGTADGEPGAGPQKVGVAVADLATGLYAATAVSAALYERERSGQGQYIDLALMDSLVALLANQNMNYLVGGQPPVRRGTAHPNIVPYQAFQTRDGWLMLAVGNDQQFKRCCEAVDAPALAADARFQRNADRVRNREVLVGLLEPVLAGRDTADWMARLSAARVPCGPINDLAQVFDDPQVRHRGLRIDLPHPLADVVPQVASPIRYSRTPPAYQQAPPLLGQHTEEVLGEWLGLGAAQVATLRQGGVIC